MLSITVTLYPNRRRAGILLAATQDTMRLALEGAADAMELRRIDGQWVGEDRQPVDFDVLLTDGHADLDRFELARPRVMAAGCV